MSKRDELIEELQELAAAEKAAGHCKKTTMAAEPNKAGSSDRKRICLENDDELRDWAASLECGEQDLREAVNVVGPSVEEVRRYLSYRKR